MTTIIDLSSYQKDTTVSTLKATGAKYAIIKISEGTTYVNPYVASLKNKCEQAGIKGFAYYHFAQFGDNATLAKQEADFCIKRAKALGIPKGSLIIVDVENRNNGTTGAKAFLAEIQNSGYKSGFYTYKFLYPNFNIKTLHSVFDFFWAAAYPLGSGAAFGKPDFHYFPSNDYIDVWQYTDNINGLGIDGSIIVNDKCEKLFNKPIVKPDKPKTKPKTNKWIDELGDTWYKSKGQFTLKVPTNLRFGAKTTSKLIATLPKGSVIKYDAYSDHDGYRWFRQPRGNGQYGYIVG